MTAHAAELYVNLLKSSLSGLLNEDPPIIPGSAQRAPFDAEKRRQGVDWPATALTMIGSGRLDNLERCLRDVLQRGVPGDVIETGAWRGGASIFMRGVLAAYGDWTRLVWVADSFEGLPQPDAERYPQDAGDTLWSYPELAVSLDEVRANFDRYGLLDERVRFVQGWFRDTLPTCPVEQLAVMRLDGDLYESTLVALDSLYPKLSLDGYVIIDDYALETCRAAVDDYRAEHGIENQLVRIDWTGVYWRKGA